MITHVRDAGENAVIRYWKTTYLQVRDLLEMLSGVGEDLPVRVIVPDAQSDENFVVSPLQNVTISEEGDFLILITEPQS